MANRFKKQPINSRIVILVGLALIIFILMVVDDHPQFIEHYYSNGLYRAVCYIFHPIFNLFPFSVGDLFYMLVVCYLLYAAVKLIRLLIKREWRPAGTFFLGLIIGVQIFILSFYLLWGMNYYRPSAAKRLNLPDSGYTTADLKLVTSILIDSANICRNRVTKADLQQGNQVIYNTATRAIIVLSDSSTGFHTYKPQIKPSILTALMNYMGTSGYYNPFTSEAQINYQMPVFLKPFVACHEMSHQMGFGPEDEANFAGFIAGTHSKDRLLRYSAYYLGVEEFMFALRQRDSIARKELKKHISQPILNDFKTEREYWLSYEGKLGVLSSLFYDDFLKANNQPQGLNTYNQMVTLVMGWYKKNNLIR